MKTYKFLAIAYNADPEIVGSTIVLMRIKASRSDTAEETARARIAKLEKKTGVKWTLHSEPAPMSARDKRFSRMRRLARKVNDLIFLIAGTHKGFSEKVMDLMNSEKYQETDIPEGLLIVLAFLRHHLGDSEMLHEAVELALRMNPLILKRPEFLEDSQNTIKWLTTPQEKLDGEIPWTLMQTKEGAKRVLRLLRHINDWGDKYASGNGQAQSSRANSSSGVFSATISNKGAIRLPRKVLETIGLEEGDTVELIDEDGNLRVIPSKSRPRAYKRLLALATQVFNNNEGIAAIWLHEPQFLLGGKRPIDYMRTAKGVEAIESILGSISYGGAA